MTTMTPRTSLAELMAKATEDDLEAFERFGDEEYKTAVAAERSQRNQQPAESAKKTTSEPEHPKLTEIKENLEVIHGILDGYFGDVIYNRMHGWAKDLITWNPQEIFEKYQSKGVASTLTWMNGQLKRLQQDQSRRETHQERSCIEQTLGAMGLNTDTNHGKGKKSKARQAQKDKARLRTMTSPRPVGKKGQKPQPGHRS